MPITDDLKTRLEREEQDTVGTAFGGNRPARRHSYSVATVRDWLRQQAPFTGPACFEQALRRAYDLHSQDLISSRLLTTALGNLIRFSFLIELTNLKVGSTKMKTRWLPGRILMPQPDSFEPVQGTFEPGNDPRASSFADCCDIFVAACTMFCDAIEADGTTADLLQELRGLSRVPYEFPFTYTNAAALPVHTAANLRWVLNDVLRWLVKARRVLRDAPAPIAAAIRQIEKKKFEVKVFKTDRSLTGKDKTNRAKRWEVLVDDFQHASIEECWSAEQKLTTDLIHMEGCPDQVKQQFVDQELIQRGMDSTCCPVTLEPLSFQTLSNAVLDPKHGVSDYQIGHLHPLKRGGNHDGDNVCWQSADGNRIQGDLTIEDTVALLAGIAARRAAQRQ